MHKDSMNNLLSASQSNESEEISGSMKRALNYVIGGLLGSIPFVASAEPRGEALGWLKHPEHHHHLSGPPVVPEVNVGLVLVPLVFAILLLASRQLFFKRGTR